MSLELEQLLHQLLHQLQLNQLPQLHNLGNWSYPLIALVAMFEGPLVTFLGATAASAGLLNPLFVFLAIVSGNLAGDMFWYSLGRVGNPNWLIRHGGRLRITPQSLEQFHATIQQGAPRFIFLTKLTSSLIIPALIATGLSRVAWRRWLPYLVAAEALKSASLLLLGYFFGSALLRFEETIQFLPLLLGLLLLLYLLLHRLHAAPTADASNSIRLTPTLPLQPLPVKFPSYESLSRQLETPSTYEYNQLRASNIYRRL